MTASFHFLDAITKPVLALLKHIKYSSNQDIPGIPYLYVRVIFIYQSTPDCRIMIQTDRLK